MGAFGQLVWALVHSMWEGAAVGAGLWCALRAAPARWVRVRYAAALGAMGLVVFGVMVTWAGFGRLLLGRRTAVRSVVGGNVMRAGSVEEVGNASGEGPRHSLAWVGSRKIDWTKWAGIFWIVGSGAMLVRVGAGLVRAQRLMAVGEPVELPMLKEVAEEMGVRRVRALVSAAYRVPAVIGAWSPVVLVPLSVVSEVSAEQMRMILAHELAHVRRWDFLVNVVQQVIEALLFFNPAVWWISQQVGIEREACCDAAAVRGEGDAARMAETLSRVAERLAGNGGMPQAAMAISGRRGVVERVRRLVKPRGRVELAFPVRTLAAGLVATAVVVAMLGGTAELSVMAAERILTPAERVEKMAALEEEGGPAGGSPEQANDKVLSGVIKTEDGEALPRRMQVMAMIESRGNRYWRSLSADKSGHFSRKVGAGRAQVWVNAPGYATAFSEAVRIGKDGDYPPMELVLGRGFDGKVVVRNAQGAGLAGAKVKGETMGVDEKTYVTDETGTLVMPHASARAMRIQVEEAGYQFDAFTVTLKEDAVAEVVMTPARATEGTVVDEKTGEAIGGAEIGLVQRAGFSDCTYNPTATYELNRPPVVAKTDDAGHFRIDGLRDDATYVFWASAKGHGSALEQEVGAGERVTWKLGPARVARLKIEADAGEMPKEVSVENPLQLKNQGYSEEYKVPVVVENGVGVAEVEDPLPGMVRFTVGAKSVAATEDPTGWHAEMDLRKGATPAQEMREVVLKFEWPADGTELRGKVRVDHIEASAPHSYVPEEVEVKGGEARVKVPVPTTVAYSQGSLVGYRMEEKSGIAVEAGTGAVELTVKLKPAGAIFGTVTDADGKPPEQYFAVSLVPVREPDPGHPLNLQPYNGSDRSGKYLLGPLPFGGAYRVLAWSGARFVVSDELAVDAEHSVREVNLRFAEGVTLSGVVRDPHGKGAAGLEVELSFQVQGLTGTWEQTGRTDRDGRFAFEHVDPAAGDYSVIVKPGRETRGLAVTNVAAGSGPVEIQLKEGLIARGRLVTADGKGIGNEVVTLRPAKWDEGEYSGEIEATTNAEGEFEARGLEPLEYAVNSVHTFAATAKVLRDAAGKVTGVQMPADPETIRGGETGVKEIHRIRSPWE